MRPTPRWRSGDPPLVPRADPLADPRLAVASFVVTAGCVIAVRSVPFAVVLLGALLGHELAHRAVARHHGAAVGWPVFLPVPFFVGTLGALLPVRAWPRGRSALLEVGAAGPIAGFVVAFAVMLARAVGGGAPRGEGLASPIVWALLTGAVRGEAVPIDPEDPWLHGAWAVCLLTGMNLLPIGQLDGGHVSSAVAGSRARGLHVATAVVVLALGWGWSWWWPWLAALGLLGGWRGVPVGMDPLTLRARAVGVAAAGVWGLCFLPVPW